MVYIEFLMKFEGIGEMGSKPEFFVMRSIAQNGNLTLAGCQPYAPARGPAGIR